MPALLLQPVDARTPPAPTSGIGQRSCSEEAPITVCSACIPMARIRVQNSSLCPTGGFHTRERSLLPCRWTIEADENVIDLVNSRTCRYLCAGTVTSCILSLHAFERGLFHTGRLQHAATWPIRCSSFALRWSGGTASTPPRSLSVVPLQQEPFVLQRQRRKECADVV